MQPEILDSQFSKHNTDSDVFIPQTIHSTVDNNHSITPIAPGRYQASRHNQVRSSHADGVIGIDNRQTVTDRSMDPYTTVGFIVSRWTGRDGRLNTGDDIIATGSGALIGEYHVLTAGHVIHNKEFGGFANSVQFVPGSGGQAIGSRWAGDVYAASDERYGRAEGTFVRALPAWVNREDLSRDFGLITLDRTIGNFAGWMNYGYNNALQSGIQLNVTGYPTDRFDTNGDGWDDNYDMTTQSGTITTVTPNELRSTELDYIGGNSGGPLWDASTRTIYGVVSNSDILNGMTVSSDAPRITPAIFNTLENWMAQDQAVRRGKNLPDLVEYDAWFGTRDASISKTVVRPGDAFSITSYPQNNGTAASGRFRVSFYASSDGDVTNGRGDWLIGSRMMSPLAPFSWNTANWQGVFPSIPAGRYRIVAMIDPNNMVQELDDTPIRNQHVIGTVLTVHPSRRVTGRGHQRPLADAGDRSPSIPPSSDRLAPQLAGLSSEPPSARLRSSRMIHGTDGTDSLVGTARAEEIQGYYGNDLCFGQGGDDMINGGGGDDLLYGGAGHDVIMGGNFGGQDVIFGEAGNDSILAGQIVGNVSSRPGKTRVVDRHIEYVSGGAGRDEFIVGLGAGIQFIQDFQMNQDTIAITAGMRLGRITLTQQQDGLLMTHGRDEVVFLKGAQLAQATQEMFTVF